MTLPCLWLALCAASVVASISARGPVVRGVQVRQHVLSPAEFAAHPETFGCCAVAGSEPLDKSLKQFITWSHGFFVEAGAYDGIQQVWTLALRTACIPCTRAAEVWARLVRATRPSSSGTLAGAASSSSLQPSTLTPYSATAPILLWCTLRSAILACLTLT